MELHYKKQDNSKLFHTFSTIENLTVNNVQNYIPIYETFFTLSKNNANTMNLNHTYSLMDILEMTSYNSCTAKVIDICNNTVDREVFFKFSPLLDPIKYMIGKYDISDNNLLNIPSFENENSHFKIRDKNNASYTDGFFSFLSSKLLNEHNFIHGTDFYGAFLGNKKDFNINIYDELDYLHESKYFCQHKNSLFELDNKYYDEYCDNYTKTNREKLSIQDVFIDNSNNCSNPTIIDLKYINDISGLNNLFITANTADYKDLEILYTNSLSANKKISTNSNNSLKYELQSSSSSCSSRSSNTNSSVDSSDDSSSDSGSNSMSSYSTATEDSVNATLHDFPIEIIALEKCDKTFDSFLLHEDIRDDELGSIILQLLMILITFQKVFHMTHNDLHTNNIMYISTKKEYLYYKFNDKYYKVPTFGKIYKIIDFGRAIYKYRGKLICSDSFHKDGDGATQYNCEPYYNSKKKCVEPNYSFDLCRLACSMFDFFIDDLNDIIKIKSPIIKIIISWCSDDEGRNVLYKSNGKERYPDFKLYKMIARTVHKHIPENVIQNEYFSKFIISKKKITKKKTIMNIDTYPDYSQQVL
jgi:hypothetical protein